MSEICKECKATVSTDYDYCPYCGEAIKIESIPHNNIEVYEAMRSLSNLFKNIYREALKKAF